MSKTNILASIALAALIAAPALAVTPGSRETKGSGYAVLAQDLTEWHLAFYGASATRTVKNKGFESEMDITRINAILGYDISRWITVYGLIGVLDASPESSYDDDDESSALFGVGAWFNLFQSEELTYLSTLSYYRLTAGTELSFSQPGDFMWSQFDSFLTFEIVNELHGSPVIMPDKLSVFFGPVASVVISDDYDQDSSNTVGFTAGLSLQFTTSTYLTIAYEAYSDDDVASGMLGVRF